MFSYSNKVVAIKAQTINIGNIDVLVNDAYVGSITDDVGAIGGRYAYFIGSSDSSLNLGNYPSSVSFVSSFDGDPQGSGFGYNEGTFSGEYPAYYFLYDDTDIFVLTYPKSGGKWLLDFDNLAIAEGGTDPSNPYGNYELVQKDFTYFPPGYSVNISPNPDGQPNVYHFSDLSLNVGLNELVSVKESSSSINSVFDINLFDISGSTLVNPTPVTKTFIGSSGGEYDYDFYTFDLQYPTGRSVLLTETPPVFNVDTGNLNQVFTGSGVHLKKDVTFFFDILDQQLNTISSNQQFLENPLISGCVFDILNANGTTVVENFFTGKYSRSLAVSALDNENIFGSYQKDFGVRCKLPNTFDGSIFTGEFYAYGNVPNILDITPDYAEFSGAAQATELINAAIVLQNDLNFTQMDRYDVYALTGSGSAVNELTYLSPFAEEGYLFSQSAANVVNARSLTINRGALPQDVPHYFTVVPYGALGSGNSFVFGPATFVTVENVIVFPETDSSSLNLYDGNSFGQTVYKTGRFLSNTGILHEFSSGQFTSVKYFIEVSGSGQRILSELRGVVNTTGFDLTKEPVNDTTTQYQLTGFASGQCGLFASGSGYADYSYKLQATMIGFSTQ